MDELHARRKLRQEQRSKEHLAKEAADVLTILAEMRDNATDAPIDTGWLAEQTDGRCGCFTIACLVIADGLARLAECDSEALIDSIPSMVADIMAARIG